MKLQCLKHTEIDRSKYEKCITNAHNGLVYAEPWYLDIVAPQWHLIVYNDYHAVMPLPVRRKLGFNYVFIPPWTQQLGVFSDKRLEKAIIKNMIAKIPQRFIIKDLILNHDNVIEEKNLEHRKNYILPLNKDYIDIYKDFSHGRKGHIKKAIQSGLKYVEVKNAKNTIELFIRHKGKNLSWTTQNYQQLNRIVERGILLNKVKVFEIYSNTNELLGGNIFLTTANRITNLFTAVSAEGRRLNAISFLFNAMIQTYSNTLIVFDFEGSMIKNVEMFYKSFGAQLETYSLLRMRTLGL